MLLAGKKILVTGVLMRSSIAFAVARAVQEAGGEVLLTSFGRPAKLTAAAAKHLDPVPDVVELDVTRAEDFDALTETLRERWGRVDGVLHAVASAPESCLSDSFLDPSWEDVATALHVSAYSLAALTRAILPLVPPEGASVVGLDFDATKAWSRYHWMGVSKAALEAIARYLALELGPHGVRVNLVSAGPIRTMSSRGVALAADFYDLWQERAPLGWDGAESATAVGRTCVALFSHLLATTSGEIIHADGGAHSVGYRANGTAALEGASS